MVVHLDWRKNLVRKNIRKNLFSVRVLDPLNQLPEEVVTAPTLNTFKNCLDKFTWDLQFTVYPEYSWVSNKEGYIKVELACLLPAKVKLSYDPNFVC